MKLFRGQTLADDLATRVAQLADVDPFDDPANHELAPEYLRALKSELDEARAEELRRLARVFEQVCQAVAYAHSQGVIHRDLKPANIMVAAFGEIQVMDWGLAKRLREPATVAAGQPAAPRGPEANPSDGPAVWGADLTSPGAVLGTFAYMPPEQARGETQAVDARADVFALGAILCRVLTGRPPYLGRTAEEVWQQAAAGDLAAARAQLLSRASAANDDLEAKLVTLALSCLAPTPADRPAHAGEVAVAVTAALTRTAESHRQAELDQMRTDTEMGYGRKRGRFAVELAALGWCLFFVLIWLFGYAFRAMEVGDAMRTAEKKQEKQIRWLQESLEAANREKQFLLDVNKK